MKLFSSTSFDLRSYVQVETTVTTVYIQDTDPGSALVSDLNFSAIMRLMYVL